MKKKILLTITFIMIIIFIPCVRAEGNMKVIFNTSFEEQIDINKIDEIFIMMDDANLKDYEIVLQHDKNFRFELDNLPVGDIVINSITVSRDYTVDYDYQYAITKTSDEEMIISLLVTKVSKDPNRKKVEVSNEYIAEILGYDPLKITTDDIDTNTSITESSNVTTSTPIDNDDPIVITSSNSTPSTKNEEEIKELEKIKQEEEKKQEQSKRKSIYLMILLVVIAVVIIIGIIAGVKIANANK